jgi:tryptophan-rich sensory protein
MPDPTNLRRHRAITDRNLLLGFFAVLFIVGGALIFIFYGGGAAALGIACMAVGAILAGVVTLVMLGLDWVSGWLDRK